MRSVHFLIKLMWTGRQFCFAFCRGLHRSSGLWSVDWHPIPASWIIQRNNYLLHTRWHLLDGQVIFFWFLEKKKKLKEDVRFNKRWTGQSQLAGCWFFDVRSNVAIYREDPVNPFPPKSSLNSGICLWFGIILKLFEIHAVRQTANNVTWPSIELLKIFECFPKSQPHLGRLIDLFRKQKMVGILCISLSSSSHLFLYIFQKKNIWRPLWDVFVDIPDTIGSHQDPHIFL